MNFLNTLIAIILLLTVAPLVHSETLSCKDKTLRIGCSNGCKTFYARAITQAALRAKTNVLIIDLSKENAPISSLDGILFPGGEDISPSKYFHNLPNDFKEQSSELLQLEKRMPKNFNAIRDDRELSLLTAYFNDESAKDLPLIGICRGLQLLAVFHKIPLYYDIKEQTKISNRYFKLDKIEIADKSSKVFNFNAKNLSFRAFKWHHQGIDMNYYQKNVRLFPQIHITATSKFDDTTLAEVMEFSNRPIIGLQAHIEITPGDVHTKLFDWFIDMAILRHSSTCKK